MRRFGPSGSGTCHCPIQSYYLPVPRDLPATNQCTFHHRSWATGATLEGNYKWNWPKGTTSQQPWPAKRTSKVRCGLVSTSHSNYHPSWSRPPDIRFKCCSDSNFRGHHFWCYKVQRILSRLYWLMRHICARDSLWLHESKCKLNVVLMFAQIQFLIYASRHLLYRHFLEDGQSESKKHLSDEHLKESII